MSRRGMIDIYVCFSFEKTGERWARTKGRFVCGWGNGQPSLFYSFRCESLEQENVGL